MTNKSLFTNEEEVIKNGEKILSEYKSDNQVPLKAYSALHKQYQKIFKQLRLLVKMGDKQQNKLNKLNEKLDLQNLVIKKTFGRYLSDDIVKSILETPEGSSLGGERREVTILMNDLRGFTSLTEKLSAETVVKILNNYLELMTGIIFKYQGTIDEFIGDSILVIFGAPVKIKDHAKRAVACAVEMQLAMSEVNKYNTEQGFPLLEMGIGINTGELIVGNIGSQKRAKYGVVGSNVNLTSRIESYTSGGEIFISEYTKDSCGNSLKINSDFSIKAKGFEKEINVFDINGIGDSYNLNLPIRSDWELPGLSDPISMNISRYDGKYLTEESYRAALLKFANNRGIIESNTDFKRFDNLELFIDPGQNTKYERYTVKVISRQIDQSDPKKYLLSVKFSGIQDLFLKK